MGPVRSGDKRQQIIDTAYALFKRDGYHATGIDRIIAEAEVAKMTMYRHFPSKDRLIVEVLKHRTVLSDTLLDQLVSQASTPEQKIDAIFGYYANWFERPDFHGCIFAHALAEYDEPDHPVHEAAVAQKNGFRDRLLRILTEAIPDERASIVARALVMLCEGATLLAQMGQGEQAIHAARQAAASLIASGRAGR